MKLIAAAVFAAILSTFEKQVQTGTALRTNGCGHCGEKEAYRCNDRRQREKIFCARVKLFGLSEIKTVETYHLSSNVIFELLT